MALVHLLASGGWFAHSRMMATPSGRGWKKQGGDSDSQRGYSAGRTRSSEGASTSHSGGTRDRWKNEQENWTGRKDWGRGSKEEEEEGEGMRRRRRITGTSKRVQSVSEGTFQRSHWGQIGSTKSVSGRDFTLDNPLIERLKKMQEELENDDEGRIVDFDDVEAHDRVTRDFRDFESPSGSGGQLAMARIAEKLSSIPGSRRIYESNRIDTVQDGRDSASVRKPGQPVDSTVEHGWNPNGDDVGSVKELQTGARFPWEKAATEDEHPESLSRMKPPSLAELTIPEEELNRLRRVAMQTMHRVKVGNLGVTNAIVELIHSEWRNSEVVRVQCHGLPLQNMKRTHEALEERTGGLVVLRAGNVCLIYRGKHYVPPPVRELPSLPKEFAGNLASQKEEKTSEANEAVAAEADNQPQTCEEKLVVPSISSIYNLELEREAEEILSTLGPRCSDWGGAKPVPIDADLLLDPGKELKKPKRLLPQGGKPSLTDFEMANLRRLGRPVCTHFVLGVHKGLGGVAAAIIKLWEKSEIVKIAVKHGVHHSNLERMAKELKRLTGGVLLSRDKYFIVLYCGKDFIPPSAVGAVEDKHALATGLQEEENVGMLHRNKQVLDTAAESISAARLSQPINPEANWEELSNRDEEPKIIQEGQNAARIRQIQRKMSITAARKSKAAQELAKVEKCVSLAGPPVDCEKITDEERHTYRKLGLKMHSYLLLGRRGVFGGTIENMHLHWKHRELVKIIYKAKSRVDLEQTARMLEYESGGILVATLPTSKGQGIILFRGKNYQRPSEIRPQNLLTRRQALKRSLEMQRQKALEKHLLDLERDISYMQADLIQLKDEGKARQETTANKIEESLVHAAVQPKTFSGQKLPNEHQEHCVGNERKHGNLDSIFRADPLSRREKLILRQQALKVRKCASQFNVGKSNVVAGLARAIRTHFQKHALVRVGVRGRAKGTPVEEVLYQLEEGTGGTLVSQEHSKIILYRGWPEGHERPTPENGHWEEVSAELRNAMIAEAAVDEHYLLESDGDEYGGEDDQANNGANYLQVQDTCYGSI